MQLSLARHAEATRELIRIDFFRLLLRHIRGRVGRLRRCADGDGRLILGGSLNQAGSPTQHANIRAFWFYHL